MDLNFKTVPGISKVFPNERGPHDDGQYPPSKEKKAKGSALSKKVLALECRGGLFPSSFNPKKLIDEFVKKKACQN
jgi:hypothetical protein